MTEDTIIVTLELPAQMSAMIMKLTMGIDLTTDTNGEKNSLTMPDL